MKSKSQDLYPPLCCHGNLSCRCYVMWVAFKLLTPAVIPLTIYKVGLSSVYCFDLAKLFVWRMLGGWGGWGNVRYFYIMFETSHLGLQVQFGQVSKQAFKATINRNQFFVFFLDLPRILHTWRSRHKNFHSDVVRSSHAHLFYKKPWWVGTVIYTCHRPDYRRNFHYLWGKYSCVFLLK